MERTALAAPPRPSMLISCAALQPLAFSLMTLTLTPITTEPPGDSPRFSAYRVKTVGYRPAAQFLAYAKDYIMSPLSWLKISKVAPLGFHP